MKIAGQHEPRLFSTRSRSAIAGLCLLVFLPYFSYILLGWERLERMQACVFFAAKPSPSPLRVKSQHSSAISSDSLKTAETMAAKWAQKTVVIPPQKRGCHLITPKILKEVEQDLSGFKCGLAHLFIQHTSASLTINENYDSDVRADTETFLNRIVPEGPSAPWKHTMEGPDDMPAHIKSSMFGCSLTIPITDGRLNMGTWQGIWLCEHRDYATPRKIVVTLNGV
ncbi:uncharacterized protein LOC131222291 [Magnolia sinica]|uniref:uncharacterized protein LOC131222291 n=1 Tax=Magnolia sinica TaxID=86752 RepID=UPI002659C2B5|nr:uncharacterized protein LOC131222291 [Magnolia sinica]